MKTIHYRPSGQTSMVCGFSPEQFRGLAFTADLHEVSCKNCLGEVERRKQHEARPERYAAAGAKAFEAPLKASASPERLSVSSHQQTPANNQWLATTSRNIHFKPFGWAATACRISPLRFPALVCTIDPHQVSCRNCLSLMRGAIGDGALHADAIREITAIALDIATKQDIAELRTFVEIRFRELTTALSGTPHPRYMNVEQCAAYISKSSKAVRMMVRRAQIPYVRVGRTVRFDREQIDKWMARQTSKRKPI